jgi:hypothetical protein
MSRKASDLCRNGHLKAGKNVIIHRRGDKIIKECRKCKNIRERALRAARKRNAELLGHGIT